MVKIHETTHKPKQKKECKQMTINVDTDRFSLQLKKINFADKTETEILSYMKKMCCLRIDAIAFLMSPVSAGQYVGIKSLWFVCLSVCLSITLLV